MTGSPIQFGHSKLQADRLNLAELGSPSLTDPAAAPNSVVQGAAFVRRHGIVFLQ
jgi:hypothetical protein